MYFHVPSAGQPLQRRPPPPPHATGQPWARHLAQGDGGGQQRAAGEEVRQVARQQRHRGRGWLPRVPLSRGKTRGGGLAIIPQNKLLTAFLNFQGLFNNCSLKPFEVICQKKFRA